MKESGIDRDVVADRVLWIRRMLADIRELPLEDREKFFSDKRNVAAAESYLRRAIEALLDLGRHILAKHFNYAATEYKEIARALKRERVVSKEAGDVFIRIAGYRNRMVHFYNEITPEELYEICSRHLGDIEMIMNEILEWLGANVKEVK